MAAAAGDRRSSAGTSHAPGLNALSSTKQNITPNGSGKGMPVVPSRRERSDRGSCVPASPADAVPREVAGDCISGECRIRTASARPRPLRSEWRLALGRRPAPSDGQPERPLGYDRHNDEENLLAPSTV